MMFEILVIVFAFFAINRSWKRFEEGKETMKSFIFWFLLWIGLIALILVPGTMDFVASNIGIGRGVDVIIYITIIVLFYLSFRTDIKIEKINQDITKIVRELTFMNERIKKK